MSESAARGVPMRRRPMVLAEALPGAWVRDLLLVVGAAGLVGLSAQLSVPLPFTPVPVTGQTFAVLVSAAVLGGGRGVASVALYLLAGIAGVPRFAGRKRGAGSPDFMHIPRSLLAAVVVGRLAALGGDRASLRTFGLMTFGTVLIYLVGVPWLAASLDVSLGKAAELGLWPFLVGDAVKAALAAGLLPTAWRIVRRTRQDK